MIELVCEYEFIDDNESLSSLVLDNDSRHCLLSQTAPYGNTKHIG